MSFRDITAILKKEAAVNDGVDGNGTRIGVVNYQQQQSNDSSNNSNHFHSNERSTQAYTLYDKGKKPVDVAIELGLSEKEATKYYTEYWRLKRLYKLHSVYKELKGFVLS